MCLIAMFLICVHFITGTHPNIKEPGHADQDTDQPMTSQKLNALSTDFYLGTVQNNLDFYNFFATEYRSRDADSRHID
jgi:hypothetical protein